MAEDEDHNILKAAILSISDAHLGMLSKESVQAQWSLRKGFCLCRDCTAQSARKFYPGTEMLMQHPLIRDKKSMRTHRTSSGHCEAQLKADNEDARPGARGPAGGVRPHLGQRAQAHVLPPADEMFIEASTAHALFSSFLAGEVDLDGRPVAGQCHSQLTNFTGYRYLHPFFA